MMQYQSPNAHLLTILSGLMVVTVFLFSGCSETEEQAVSVAFSAQIDGEDFACGESYADQGSTQTTLTVNDFRFYIHDLRLVDADGVEVEVMLAEDGVWQRDGIALLDFEDGGSACEAGTPQTNTSVVGTVPAGDYTGIRFRVGVPFEHNHADPNAEAPLNLVSMHWNWAGGYKFMRIDGQTDGLQVWRLHLGSTGCDGDPLSGGTTVCAQENIVDVEIDNFDVASDVVVAELASVLANIDLDSNAEESQPGCMSAPSDADCAPYFDALGLPFDGSTPPTQGLFSKL